MNGAVEPLDLFEPETRAWFQSRFEAPTDPQIRAWPMIARGQNTLVAAPTGSGKTLCAFLCAIDSLLKRGRAGELEDRVYVVYISPLKALGNDVEKNLQAPLREILPDDDRVVRSAVRTGDTSARDRQRMVRQPPHILVTTPESLYILLTSVSGREMLHGVEAVIVDEIHAVATDKRGSHLSLTLERLDRLTSRPLQRIGLSATQRPIERVAEFLVGERGDNCTIVDGGHRRAMNLEIAVPRSRLSAVMAEEVWVEVLDTLAELIRTHSTTLLFVNTRRMAERLTAALEDLVGVDAVTSHHGSLSRAHRLRAEQALKDGSLKAMVATASMELGIDVGDIDLVCQIGTTRSIATMLQRVGRAGHGVGRTPKGRLFPLSRDELVEFTAIVHAAQTDELDRLVIPEAPLDILAQHIVSCVAMEEWDEDELFEFVRRAHAYRNLDRSDFDAIVAMLAAGFATRRGRRGAYLHQDAVNGRLRPRKAARMVAVGNAGAIPENADYDVRLDATQQKIGTLNEDFAIESMIGDVFRLGNSSWQILKVEPGKVFVAHAPGLLPSIPFWLGEAPSRTAETSEAVSKLRVEVAVRGMDDARRWLVDTVGLSDEAAVQVAEYLTAGMVALGEMPTQECIVLERFFDESGGMQLVIHSPFGARMNRAWGLALRKKFCRRFNFELQAAATEDAIVLSLGETHSFELAEVFDYLSSGQARHVLIQALLDAPMFETRWRWNANRSLAVPRMRAGKKVPPLIQRMNAQDLVSVVFPDQIACLENIAGEREVPDHPLVKQTIEDCLHEAMDIDGLVALLEGIESGKIRTAVVDLTEPSPLASEILTAGQYAFLDDAPLEERRTGAVRTRRFLSPEEAVGLGRLSPEAVSEVAGFAWPVVRDADELHDALMSLGVFTPAVDVDPDGASPTDEWHPLFETLEAESRVVCWEAGGMTRWCAVERLPHVRAVHGTGVGGGVPIPARFERECDELEAATELVRGRLEISGPITAASIAASFGASEAIVVRALVQLEGEGFAMRGHYTEAEVEEWCERRILARIHRRTMRRLRDAVRPVTSAAFVRYLTYAQGILPGGRRSGVGGLLEVLRELEGFVAPVSAWEAHILPARVDDYDPAWLDALCLSGQITWRRGAGPAGRGPVRSTPVLFTSREHAGLWTTIRGADSLSHAASAVVEVLESDGALFYGELRRRAKLLGAQAEEALSELVARGLVVSDGFSGIRALVVTGRERGRVSIEAGGRWQLVRDNEASWLDRDDAERAEKYGVDPRAFGVAKALLARWGVVFRAVVDRESGLPPWRDVHRVLRWLEARGEVRGGRFVDGFAGEQFARADVIPALRRVRSASDAPEWVSLSAADPLNLLGRVVRGFKLPTRTTNRVLLRDGEVLATLSANTIEFFGDIDDKDRWTAQQRLVTVRTPPSVRRYLGRGSATAPKVAS